MLSWFCFAGLVKCAWGLRSGTGWFDLLLQDLLAGNRNRCFIRYSMSPVSQRSKAVLRYDKTTSFTVDVFLCVSSMSD